MNVFATASFVYGNFSRWQLWFDNPNKAAVLFACLALVALAWGFRCLEASGIGDCQRRVRVSLSVWFAALLGVFFSGFVYMLLHTFSRGGLLAFGVGALVVAGRRMWRHAFLLALLAVLACMPLGWSAAGRLMASSPGRDASVGNRLVLWQTVPRMMADAPGGWGLGNAGAAFMSWYQPVERRENYRTLVGSHVTWLVEFGRMGRVAYIVGWLSVLGACGVFCFRRKDGLPLALWLCLGTAAVFSSVAEAWEVWVLPVAAFVPVVLSVWRRCATVVGVSALIGLAFVEGIEFVGRRQAADAVVRIVRDRAGGRTVVGVDAGEVGGCPRSWIVYDATVLGGPSFGRVLRANIKDLRDGPWGVADTLDAVPAHARRLAVCGKSAAGGVPSLGRFAHLADVRVLSPEKPQAWLAAKAGDVAPKVFCGEFSAACPDDDLPGVTVVPGARDYLPEWPRHAFR